MNLLFLFTLAFTLLQASLSHSDKRHCPSSSSSDCKVISSLTYDYLVPENLAEIAFLQSTTLPSSVKFKVIRVDEEGGETVIYYSRYPKPVYFFEEAGPVRLRMEMEAHHSVDISQSTLNTPCPGNSSCFLFGFYISICFCPLLI